MKHSFTLDIRPQAKERARKGRGHWYTPHRTVTFESAVKNTARSAGCRPLKNACILRIVTTFKLPKKGSPSQHCTKRPDWDNLGKTISDALNGVAYVDDSQVVIGVVSKKYGEHDMIEVEIEYLD